MSMTAQDALSVETHRRYRLLWLNGLEVLSKALVAGIAIYGASHDLPNNGQGRLNPSPDRPLRSTAQAGHLFHPGMPPPTRQPHVAREGAHRACAPTQSGQPPRRKRQASAKWHRLHVAAISTASDRDAVTASNRDAANASAGNHHDRHQWHEPHPGASVDRDATRAFQSPGIFSRIWDMSRYIRIYPLESSHHPM